MESLNLSRINNGDTTKDFEIPEEATTTDPNGSTESADAVEEASGEKRDALTKINKILIHFPKLIHLFSTLLLANGLSMVHKGLFEIDKNEVPTINYQTRGAGRELPRDIQSAVEAVNKQLSYEGWVIEDLPSIEEASQRDARIEAPIPTKVRVLGWERTGVKAEEIERVIRETVPRGFMQNVNTIVFRDTEFLMPAAYGDKIVAGSRSAGHAESGSRKIEVTGAAAWDGEDVAVNDILMHEIAHLQDWRTNKLLTIEERFELLQKIVERLGSEYRYRSSYVEKITNEDKRRQLQMKAREYFAEIVSEYLSPGGVPLPQADREIVEDLIKKMDPKFDRIGAMQKRDEICNLAPDWEIDGEHATPEEQRREFMVHWENDKKSYADEIEKLLRSKKPNMSQDQLNNKVQAIVATEFSEENFEKGLLRQTEWIREQIEFRAKNRERFLTNRYQ